MNIMPSPSVIATASATLSSFNLVQDLLQPLIKYAISPTITIGFFVFAVNKIFNLGKIVKEFETLTTDMTDIKEKVGKLILNSTTISAHLVTKTALDAQLLQAMSPLKLTEKGNDIIKKIKFDVYYESNKAEILDKFKEADLKDLEHIDDFSQKFLEEKRSKKELDFKKMAFNNGLTTELIVRLCAVYLREIVAPTILKKD